MQSKSAEKNLVNTKTEWLNEQGLYGVLCALATRIPDATATIDRSFGVCSSSRSSSHSSSRSSLRSSYSQLLSRVDSLAIAWAEQGVTPASRVLWLGQNSARVLEGMLVCARLGAVFCPVNWRQSEAELEFVLADVEPALVIWQREEIGHGIGSLRDKFSSATQVWLQHDGEHSQYEACVVSGDKVVSGAKTVSAAKKLTDRQVDINEPVLMLYTAAFSGQPNGALLSHRAIMAQSHTFAGIRNISSATCYLNVGPLFHVATLLETMATFQAGGTNVFIRRAEAQPICEAIEQEGCSNAFLLPPLIEKIITYSIDHPVNVKSLRALPDRSEWNALITIDDSLWGRFPYGFGQTETFGYATYRALATEGIGAMGKPSSLVEVCMLDDAGNGLPPGEVGEIAVRGATVFNEYWRRPQLNAERRVGEWHRSNDLGRIEVDGSLSFIGPKARMIRSGQENIYPAEVENCLSRHPAIAEAAVIGVPDAKWDQSVKAIVVLKKDSSGVEASCSKDDISDFCKQHIASYKKPKLIEWVSELPKIGHTVDYQRLDLDFGGGGYPGQDRD